VSTVGEALRAAARRLESVSDTARLDAEYLMAHALGAARSAMLLRRTGDPEPEGFAALVERRAGHEPVAYIVGTQEFYGRSFAVSPAVLIPRADSETTLEAALDAGGDRVLDCGVGSGVLLLSYLAGRPGTAGVGIDRSHEAIEIAGENAVALGIEGDWSLKLADWHEPGWADDLGRFDLVIANPPYVETAAELDPDVREFEPAGALFAGPDGLDDYRVLVPQLAALLNPGGKAVLEIGASQAEAVGALAAQAGFAAVLHKDLAGRPRALTLSF